MAKYKTIRHIKRSIYIAIIYLDFHECVYKMLAKKV